MAVPQVPRRLAGNGTLTLTVADEAGNAGGYLEILRSPYYCCQAPLWMPPVAANEELRVHVLMAWTSPVSRRRFSCKNPR